MSVLFLTLIRFITEKIPPLWFPLLILYAAVPLLAVPKEKWSQIGFKKPEKWWPLFTGILLSGLTKIITIILLFEFIGMKPVNWMLGITEQYRSIPGMPKGVAVIVLIFMTVTPIVEEIFFRMFQSVWQNKYGALNAILISAFLFGFSHLEQFIYSFSIQGLLWRLIPIFLYGAVHAWVYCKSKSVYASMVSHLAGNITEGIILVSVILPILSR